MLLLFLFGVGVAADSAALEQLQSVVPCHRVADFLRADADVWTAFLQTQPGFQSKLSAVDATQVGCNCTVWSMIRWQSRTLWKNISSAELGVVSLKFIAAYGGNPPLAAFPTDFGLDVLHEVLPVVPPSPVDNSSGVAIVNQWTVPCAAASIFVSADNSTLSAFLQQQAGFVRRMVLVGQPAPLPAAGNCTLWTHTLWGSRGEWEGVSPSGLSSALTQLEHAVSGPVAVEPFPTRLGFDVILST